MRSRRVWILGVAALLVAALVVVGIRFANTDRALTQKPAQKAAQATEREQVTYISLPIRLSAAALTDLVNEAVPKNIPIPEKDVWSGRVRILGVRVSATARAGGAVDLRDKVIITSVDDGLLATTKVHGQVTAKIKNFGRETAKADVNVNARIRFDVDDAWKPKVTIEPSYSWINRPKAKVLGLFDLSLGTVAGDALDDEIAKWRATLPALVEQKLDLQGVMGAAWQDAHTSVQLSQAPAAWLTIDPVGMHFLPPRTDDGDLLLNLGLSARLNVASEKPEEMIPKPLPNLRKEPPPSDGFQVAVPVRVAYATIEQEVLKALKGKPLKVDSGHGIAEIEVDQISVYPAAPRLVVGAHVRADLPDRWLDTRGMVYLFAEPVYDEVDRTLELKNIEFARSVDNKVVRFLTVALKSQLTRELQAIAKVDLAEPIEGAVKEVNTFLSTTLEQSLRSKMASDDQLLQKLVSSIDVTGSVDRVDSVSFQMTDNALTIFPVVSGSLAVELQPAVTTPAPSALASVEAASLP